MFHVFGAEFCRAPCRGGGAPWLSGRGRGMTARQVTPSTHVCYLSGITGGMTHWTVSFPTSNPLFNETQGCSWLVQTGWRGTLQPGERFPNLLSCFGRPRGFWEAGAIIHFLQRAIVLRSLQGTVEASNTSAGPLLVASGGCTGGGDVTVQFSSHDLAVLGRQDRSRGQGASAYTMRMGSAVPRETLLEAGAKQRILLLKSLLHLLSPETKTQAPG